MPSIIEFVARARRRRSLQSLLESSALALAAGAVAVAAAALSQTPSGEVAGLFDLAACGALSGIAAGGTWWVERAKKSDLELARKLDARLERDGALCTVYEARLRGDRGAAARWLEERVTAGLDRGSLAKGVPRPGWIWLAPPAIGLALAALVFELPARSIGPSPRFAAGSRGFEADSAARELARSALARARDRGTAASTDASLRVELLAELDLAAAALEGARGGFEPASSDPAGDLGREVAAERARIESGRAGSPAGGSEAEIAPGGAALPPGAGAEAGSRRDAGNSLLTNGPPDRTMVGSNRSIAAADGARPAPGEPDEGSAAEAGTIAGRWWPERYDPVVQGWKRALAARAEQR